MFWCYTRTNHCFVPSRRAILRRSLPPLIWPLRNSQLFLSRDRAAPIQNLFSRSVQRSTLEDWRWRAEYAFVKGYELVAFDIPPDTAQQERIIGWEVWSPKAKGLGSWGDYVRRLDETMNDNDAFDAVIETLEGDRSIKREEMRQIASAMLGYDVPKSRGRIIRRVADQNSGSARH